MNKLGKFISLFVLLALLASTLALTTASPVAASCSPSATGNIGANTIDCDGHTGSVDGRAGNDTITTTGTITGNVLGGAGGDVITNNGTVQGRIDGELGNDQITNNGTVGGKIDGGVGTDQINNTGTVNGNIEGGVGNDTIINDNLVKGDIAGGGILDGDVLALLGNDTIINNGDVEGNIFGSLLGNNNITNNGTVEGSITGSILGEDTVTNNGYVGGIIITGLTDDEVTITGTVVGDVYTTTGNDAVSLSGDFSVGGTIDGGEGTDTLNLEAETDNEAEFNAVKDAFDANQSSGSFAWKGGTLSWANFEFFNYILTLLASASTGGDAGGFLSAYIRAVPTPDGLLLLGYNTNEKMVVANFIGVERLRNATPGNMVGSLSTKAGWTLNLASTGAGSWQATLWNADGELVDTLDFSHTP